MGGNPESNDNGQKSEEQKKKEESEAKQDAEGKLIDLKDQVEHPEAKVEGTYLSAKSDISDPSNITSELSVEDNQKITETSITVSAGADLRKMDIAKAKAQWENKKDTLANLKEQFTDQKNKDAIDSLIGELSAENIESKITDNSKQSTTNAEQHGNRYLIAARVAEGFIQTLTDITTKDPQPLLTLKIDRDKCIIGTSNEVADKEDDRFFKIDLALTVTTNATNQPVLPITIPDDK